MPPVKSNITPNADPLSRPPNLTNNTTNVVPEIKQNIYEDKIFGHNKNIIFYYTNIFSPKSRKRVNTTCLSDDNSPDITPSKRTTQ